jgi:hypothetical protein
MFTVSVGSGEKGGNGTKIRQFTLIMGPARAEVYSFMERATIPSKWVIFYILHL